MAGSIPSTVVPEEGTAIASLASRHRHCQQARAALLVRAVLPARELSTGAAEAHDDYRSPFLRRIHPSGVALLARLQLNPKTFSAAALEHRAAALADSSPTGSTHRLETLFALWRLYRFLGHQLYSRRRKSLPRPGLSGRTPGSIMGIGMMRGARCDKMHQHRSRRLLHACWPPNCPGRRHHTATIFNCSSVHAYNGQAPPRPPCPWSTPIHPARPQVRA